MGRRNVSSRLKSDSQIRKYRFTIQARYEVGLSDEMFTLLKEAGFIELAVGN